MTWPGWIGRRLLPCACLVAVAGVVSGVARGCLGFVPGLQGMALGLATGYLTGRLGRGDDARFWPFWLRVLLALGCAGLLLAVHLPGVVLVHAWLQGLDWLPDVLNGYAQEPFVGLVLRGTHESVAGGLEGIWWVLFVLVDAGLFAFLFLVGTTLGYFPAESVSADADSSADDNGDGP